MMLVASLFMVQVDASPAASRNGIGGAVPLAGLVQNADVIIRGQVKSVTRSKVPVESMEVTYVWQGEAVIETDAVLKGRIDNSRVTVLFGEGVDFEVGEEVIVLLSKDARGRLEAVAQSQGKFLIESDRIEQRDLSTAEFLEVLNSIIYKRE